MTRRCVQCAKAPPLRLGSIHGRLFRIAAAPRGSSVLHTCHPNERGDGAREMQTLSGSHRSSQRCGMVGMGRAAPRRQARSKQDTHRHRCGTKPAPETETPPMTGQNCTTQLRNSSSRLVPDASQTANCCEKTGLGRGPGHRHLGGGYHLPAVHGNRRPKSCKTAEKENGNLR